MIKNLPAWLVPAPAGRVDVLVITMGQGEIVESDETKPGIILDYDARGNILRIEILNASKRDISPFKFEYEIA